MQGAWQASERGEGQLRELNSMIRHQEGILGTVLATFMVANAVLVFAYFQQEDHFLARTAISLVALALNGTAFLMLMEAGRHLGLRRKKALALESDLGVTQEFRIWEDTPESMLKTSVGPMAAAALLVYWGACLAYAAVSFAT